MDKEYVCKYCNKKFPSGKSLGGHIRIHSPKKINNKRRLVDQIEITSVQCRVCDKRFCSVKALASHMDCHEKMEMDTQSAASETTSSGPTMIKRSKKQKQSNSESFSSIVSSSSDPGIVERAKGLMFLHLGRKGYNLAVNSFVADESSENNSEILETNKSSSGDKLKTSDKVAVAADSDDDDDDGSSDSDSFDDDYFMNGRKKSDSGISVGGSLRNTGVGSGFNSFKNGDELRNKEGGSKHELGKSKRVLPFYESDSSADTNSKSLKVRKVSGADKNSKGHVCPICFKVYSSGQALGGHKRSHTIANQQQHKAADMQFDLNGPAHDDHDDE